MSKTIDRLCFEYGSNNRELIELLRKICVNTRRPRCMRREAHRKIEELEFIDRDDSINDHLNSETGSDCSDSTVSSASSGSSESSPNKEQLSEMMGLTKRSPMEEWLRFDYSLRGIKNEKKK